MRAIIRIPRMLLKNSYVCEEPDETIFKQVNIYFLMLNFEFSISNDTDR